MWKTDSTPGSPRTASVNASICSRACTARRTAIIACSGRPSAARSISAWKPSSTPVSRSALTRARQVEGAIPTRSASALLGRRAFSLSATRMARSIASRFGTRESVARRAEDVNSNPAFFRTYVGAADVLPHGWQNGVMRAVSSPVHTDIKDTILDAIGGTPLVRLSRFGAGLRPQLVAKLEALKPGGSINDRTAVALIEGPERDRKHEPGRT